VEHDERSELIEKDMYSNLLSIMGSSRRPP